MRSVALYTLLLSLLASGVGWAQQLGPVAPVNKLTLISNLRSISGSVASDTSSSTDFTRSWQSVAATKTAAIPSCGTANAGQVLVDVDGNGTASVSNPINITPPSGTTIQGSASPLQITTARGSFMYQSYEPPIDSASSGRSPRRL